MNVNPRLRRLMADAEHMRTEFAGHEYISVEPVGWDPPERYDVTYRLPGVALDPNTGQPSTIQIHKAQIVLTAAYPREKPYAVMETPIFHPNFGTKPGDEICIGDFWTPAQTLADIIVKIGEMIQYQSYNVRSPLNATAARWANEHEEIFPIGRIGLYQAEPDIAVLTPSAGPEGKSAKRPAKKPAKKASKTEQDPTSARSSEEQG